VPARGVLQRLSEDAVVMEDGRADRPPGFLRYAVLALLARAGLRAGEVVAVELDDIDWRAGELTVWARACGAITGPCWQHAAHAALVAEGARAWGPLGLAGHYAKCALTYSRRVGYACQEDAG